MGSWPMGKLVFSRRVGYSELGKKTPATALSDLRHCSMDKKFRVGAILKLRDEGGNPAGRSGRIYIPALKDQKKLVSDAPEITIRNLLSHSAGFRGQSLGDRQLAVTDEDLSRWWEKGFISTVRVLLMIQQYGFALLGLIVQESFGAALEYNIINNILQPLGKTIPTGYTKVPAEQLAHGYRWLNGMGGAAFITCRRLWRGWEE